MTTSRRIATTSSRSALAVGLLSLAACGASGPSITTDDTSSDAAAEIVAMLESSAASWNEGDLDGFLDDYMEGEETTFTGASGTTRGADEVRRRYLASYWSTGRPQHRLSFAGIEVRALGPDHALALGRYVLTEPDDGTVASEGIFSLVLTRTGHGWKIIHDHSSASH